MVRSAIAAAANEGDRLDVAVNSAGYDGSAALLCSQLVLLAAQHAQPRSARDGGRMRRAIGSMAAHRCLCNGGRSPNNAARFA
jgi:hypothetical protein